MKKLEPQSYIYVGIQLVLFILYLIPVADYRFYTNPVIKILLFAITLAGICIIGLAILQLNKNLTPFPAPVEGGNLIQTGLYKYVRHPIYGGIILSAVSFGIATGSTWKIGIGLVLWILFYFKSRYEEALLEKQYPEYKTYRQHTGRFFPFI
jgi:protein-S-isoprenylcysteine O-methyltransferase Ste14